MKSTQNTILVLGGTLLSKQGINSFLFPTKLTKFGIKFYIYLFCVSLIGFR